AKRLRGPEYISKGFPYAHAILILLRPPKALGSTYKQDSVGVPCKTSRDGNSTCSATIPRLKNKRLILRRDSIMKWSSRSLGIFLFVALCPSLLAQSKPNALTPKEVEEGWVLLWDGETTFGWESFGKAEWKVQDGVLSASSGDSGWLASNTPFADFVLMADFRTGADGNSGIFLRSSKENQPHQTGYELQIFDAHK